MVRGAYVADGEVTTVAKKMERVAAAVAVAAAIGGVGVVEVG